MPEVVLLRQTGGRRVVEVETPLPDALTVEGVRYVHNRHADTVEGRPPYVEAPEGPPLVRLCLHGCGGCGRIQPCGMTPCAAPGRARRCSECDP